MTRSTQKGPTATVAEGRVESNMNNLVQTQQPKTSFQLTGESQFLITIGRTKWTQKPAYQPSFLRPEQNLNMQSDTTI